MLPVSLLVASVKEDSARLLAGFSMLVRNEDAQATDRDAQHIASEDANRKDRRNRADAWKQVDEDSRTLAERASVMRYV